MATNNEQMDVVKRIIGSQFLAVLASTEHNRPYSNLVAFAETDDLRSIMFVTGRNTRKYHNISANENVSLLIDTRTNRQSDFSTAVALTVTGKAREAQAEEREALISLYLTRYPHLAQFARTPDSALIIIKVSEYIIAGFDSAPRHIAMK